PIPLLCRCRPFSVKHCAPRRDLHPFPTRRSSDLVFINVCSCAGRATRRPPLSNLWNVGPPTCRSISPVRLRIEPRASPGNRGKRSEEHTSELQSLTNLVCRLLLEKKKVNLAHILP